MLQAMVLYLVTVPSSSETSQENERIRGTTSVDAMSWLRRVGPHAARISGPPA